MATNDQVEMPGRRSASRIHSLTWQSGFEFSHGYDVFALDTNNRHPGLVPTAAPTTRKFWDIDSVASLRMVLLQALREVLNS